MRRIGRWLAGALLALPLIIILVPAIAVVGLNTATGRAFAQREINHIAGPDVRINGLGGHFPADIKIASLRLADAKGVYARAQGLELRWRPERLLQRRLSVIALTARSISVSRRPAAGKKSKGGMSLPKFHARIRRIEIDSLRLGSALVGQNLDFHVIGAGDFSDLTRFWLSFEASTPGNAAHYALHARIDQNRVAMRLQVAEPPHGLIGRLLGPKIDGPLALNMRIRGPRDAAALQFQAAAGAAKLHGTGMLRLEQNDPRADIRLEIPTLAPIGAITGQKFAGSAALHLIAGQHAHGATRLAMTGDIGLTTAPHGLAGLIGPHARFALRVSRQNKTLNIESFQLIGAQCSAAAHGSIGAAGLRLGARLHLAQVGVLAPGLSGAVSAQAHIIGPVKDFALDLQLTGDVARRGVASGPFKITLQAQHLPHAPQGTLKGSGLLENTPLAVQAAFSSTPHTGARLIITRAIWRSLNATANLALAPGASLPTGTAMLRIGRLGDFAAFAPVPLHGGLRGDFTHSDAKNFTLNLTAVNVIAAPQLGRINASLHAQGTLRALAFRALANSLALFHAPGRLSLAGVLDVTNRRASLTQLDVQWRRVAVRLLGPAQILTRPAIAVQHLALALNGGRISLDGTLGPAMRIDLTARNLPADLADMAAPGLRATGTLSATARLHGSRQAPAGDVTLTARGLKLQSGTAAGLPAVNMTAHARLAGRAADVAVSLGAGPELSLTADGRVPLQAAGNFDLRVTGRADLALANPILSAKGSMVQGIVSTRMLLSGNARAPRANGTFTLANGSVENISSGLSLTQISAQVRAMGQEVRLQSLHATAGQGSITGHGVVDLGQPGLPIRLSLAAHRATPIASDLVTVTLDGALTLAGELRHTLALSGKLKIDSAEINIPKSLPPSVANLPIIYAGQKPPQPPTPLPAVKLDLDIAGGSRIFVRGDGLFADLGGNLRILGTAAKPVPQGSARLIRGNFSLAGTNLQFTQGNIGFNGDGFMPTLDLEATSTTSTNATVTLIVGGTAAKPTITLSSVPPLPSDEILAQLLFRQSASTLSPFQAASLAAALAQLSGAGGGVSPLNKVRNALGLDQLSLGGSGSGPPTLNAGRYVAPGVYVGASQATNGQGTQANVQINLYKGLQLQTTTGASGTGTGNASSVGLTYQFNY